MCRSKPRDCYLQQPSILPLFRAQPEGDVGFGAIAAGDERTTASVYRLKGSRVMVSSVGKRMFSVLVSILIGYVLVLALCRIFESRLIFFPNYPDRLGGDWNPRGLGVQDVWLAADDGTKLHAWWIPNDAAKFTFLTFHGNAGNVADRATVYEFLKGTPANVLARSEEHTSELQSRQYLVCRLLLEKKKTATT